MKNGDKKIIIIDRLKGNQEFTVADKEKKFFIIFLTDGKNQKGSITISIKGSQADVKILGIIIGFGVQEVNLYTFQDHKEKESVSDLFIKSVLFDKAKFHYEGLIKIEKGAQKSNAYQKNQNLLMSPYAWAESKPYLEILANDVRCTHGATIGRLDNEQLYYLETRGLSQLEATILLIQGFCNDVLQRLPDEDLQEKLGQRIKEKVSKLLY